MACGRLSGLQRKGSAGRLYCRCGSMARNPESKSLVRVLLFAACLLNSSYSFVQQMLPSPVVSGTAAGSCTVQARSLSARAGYVRHLRSSRASCTMSSKAGDKDQPRWSKTRLPGEQVRRAGGAAAEENKALRTIFLNGNRNTTDSGGPGGRGKGGGNIGGGGGGGGGGGQGGGDGEGKGEGEGESGENGNEGDDDAFGIKVTGRKREKIVRKVDKAIRKGKIPQECSKAYAQLLTSPMMAVLCRNSGWRARLLGDSTFMMKLGIEMITGTTAQVVAEYQKRGSKFIRELDLVLADTLTCLFANFAAVWLSCPTVAVKAATKKGASKAGGALQAFLASCPSNAFQKVASEAGASKSFSVYQRGVSLVIPMPKLFVIGFGATLAGYGLIAALEMLSNAGKEAGEAGDEKPSVPVLGSGLAIGAFLAISTNLRYQFIAGAVEQRIFDTMLASRPGLSSLGSTAVRSANLYIGSLTIVDWLRFVGLQH